MQMSTTSLLMGAKAIDFEEHQFVSLYVQTAIKGGVGHKTHKMKLNDLSKFDHIEKTMIGKKVDMVGQMESTDKANEMVFVVQQIKIAA